MANVSYVYQTTNSANSSYLLITFKINNTRAVKLGWQHSYIGKMTYKQCKLGQTDLVFFVYDQSSSFVFFIVFLVVCFFV